MSISFGTALRRLRKKRGLTLTQIAEQIKVSYPAVQQWEADKTSPIGSNFSKLSDVLGANLSVLRIAIEAGEISDERSLDLHLTLLIDDFDREQGLLREAKLKGISHRRYEIFQQQRARLINYKAELLNDRSGYRDSSTLMAVAETLPPNGDEDFIISGRVADYVARPFALLLYEKAFGLFLRDDKLSPKYEMGDLIVYNEQIAAEANDYALIVQKPEAAEFPKKCFVRRLIDITSSEILAQQLTPARYDRFALSERWEAYRIVSLQDMLSI